MAESRAEVRLLLSTMRILDGSSSLVRAIAFLAGQRGVSVAVVVAQESQRVATKDAFPSAEFQVRGLGEWPQKVVPQFLLELLYLFLLFLLLVWRLQSIPSYIPISLFACFTAVL